MISSALTKRGPILINHRKPHSNSEADRTGIRTIEAIKSSALNAPRWFECRSQLLLRARTNVYHAVFRHSDNEKGTPTLLANAAYKPKTPVNSRLAETSCVRTIETFESSAPGGLLDASNAGWPRIGEGTSCR